MTKEEIILSMESAINERTILVRIFVGTLKQAVKLLKSQPEIVRCKDCRFWNKTIYDTPKWMPCMSVKTAGNWFCADGERKKGEQE